MKINQIKQVLLLLKNLCSLDCDDCPFQDCCLDFCPDNWNIDKILTVIKEEIE